MRRPRNRVVGMLVSLVVLICPALFAQSAYAPPPFSSELARQIDPNWGTTDLTVQTVWFTEFEAISGTREVHPNGLAYCSTPGCIQLGGIQLPAGAQIVAFELEACDTSATEHIEFTLFAGPRPEGAVALAPFGTTGETETPGCGNFLGFLPAPHTVDNFANSYILDVIPSAADATTMFRAFRVYYLLQVSPAPATATFLDVPVGHALHQYVEALVAAGITAGCGGGNFCPNSAVTRGQLAVFLAKALGLHWSP